MESSPRLTSVEEIPIAAAGPLDRPGSTGRPGLPRPLCAHLDYDPDGALLFHLSGHEERRFNRVLEDFRGAVPLADREWVSDLQAWVLYGGWDEELLELLADHFEPEEVFVQGLPLCSTED